MLILVPGFFLPRIYAELGGLYAFGSMLSFSMAHAAIIGLRIRKPELERPFKLKPNLRILKREIPVTAILGLLGTFGIWVIIIIQQPTSRLIGVIWMAAGLLMYALYHHLRKRGGEPPVAPPSA